MTPPPQDQNTPTEITQADILWRNDRQPVSKQFDDIYFSRESGLEESRYVFLEPNQLKFRWQELSCDSTFFIAECGFGTGLNFLATWQLWEQSVNTKTTSAHLHYYSVEKYPLSRIDLKKALALWPELSTFADKLIGAWPPGFVPGIHTLQFHQVTLHLYFGDIVDGLVHLLPAANCGPKTKASNPVYAIKNPAIDAWYLDGFAPAKNPAMWRAEIFSLMSRLSKPSSTFSTFTSASEVRRGLQAQGFACTKIKGFGKKREMLFGGVAAVAAPHTLSKQAATPLLSQTHVNSAVFKASWHLVGQHSVVQTPRSAIVVGGGIAGCHAAYALAKRGLKVTLVERQKLASGASANRRGVLYTRVSPHADALSRFNLSALLFATRFYEQENFFDSSGKQCGVLHLAKNAKEKVHHKTLASLFASNPEHLVWLKPEECRKITGTTLEKEGIFFPKAGWLDPVKLCSELSSHPNITIITPSTVKSFTRNEAQWVAQTDNGLALNADLLILANAADLQRFDQTEHLPLKSIRGQVSYLSDLPKGLSQPSTVICAEGYVAPIETQGLCIGASFNIESTQTAISHVDHADNLVRMGEIFSQHKQAIQEIDVASLAGNVGFRCTTPDYFPVVGPLPDAQKFVGRFSLLAKKANTLIDECGAYHSGLFCLTGLGSRGLAYAPIAAETLASTIFGEPIPISRSLLLHLHPARFIIRNLIRNRPISGLNSK